MSLRNVASFSSRELKSFLDSFDHVLCDCDGVLWMRNQPFSGVRETIAKLKKCGKQICFVSNNCTVGLERYKQKLASMQYDATIDDLAYPTQAIIDYFKTINFRKEVYLLSTSTMNKEFVDAGIKLAEVPNKHIENVEDINELLNDTQDVGAVVVDMDPNFSYPKLLKAAVFLRQPDVLFITAASDKAFPVGANSVGLGPGYFQDLLASFTNRVPIGFGKPGLSLNKYLMKRFNIENPSRTLFVGDSLEQDIGFASNCGYQKLLVLTGLSTLEQANNCANKDLTPDFYLNSFGELHELIKEKLNI